jgi:hypothetical protein
VAERDAELVTFELRPAQDEALLGLLHERDGRATTVVLRDGRSLMVFNIAWGYDAGEAFAHVTTNVSPGVPDQAVDVFSSGDVASVTDPAGDRILFESP